MTHSLKKIQYLNPKIMDAKHNSGIQNPEIIQQSVVTRQLDSEQQQPDVTKQLELNTEQQQPDVTQQLDVEQKQLDAEKQQLEVTQQQPVQKIHVQKPIIIYSRGESIKPEYIGVLVKIHNGIRFYELKINEKMIGYKFGEFSPTRRFPKHKKKK